MSSYLAPDIATELDHSKTAKQIHQSDETAPRRTSATNPVLYRARFLQGLSQREKKIVLAEARYRTYRIGSVIAEQGTQADRLFMLVNGSARYFFITPSGQKINLFWLVPGEIFGGATLLTEPARFVVSTEAVKDSQVLVWQRDAIRSLATRCPRMLESGLGIACDYLVWYLATHLSLVCSSARERLAHVLISLSQGIGLQCRDGIHLEITNEQLANTANLTPFTVSRLLSEWRKNGSISKSRGRVLLRRPEQLLEDKPA